MNNQVNVHTSTDGLSEKDVARAIAQLVYRKTYNARPEVQARRKEYNKVRQQRVKVAMEYVRKHPEVAR